MKLYADKEMEPSGDIVLFVERTNELAICGKIKRVTLEVEGKPSLNRANESYILDPKLSDLPMGRLKEW